MEHPSEEFLASVEEDLITLIMKCGQLIVQVCDKILSFLSLLKYTVNHDSSSSRKYQLILCQLLKLKNP